MIKSKMDPIHWTIVEIKHGWCLRCTRLRNHQIVTVYRKDFDKFIEALRAAQLLQIHLDNASVLPMTKI